MQAQGPGFNPQHYEVKLKALKKKKKHCLGQCLPSRSHAVLGYARSHFLLRPLPSPACKPRLISSRESTRGSPCTGTPPPIPWLLEASRPRVQGSAHLPQRLPVPLLLEALQPIVGEIGAEMPQSVQRLELPRRALLREQHPAFQSQRAAAQQLAQRDPTRTPL